MKLLADESVDHPLVKELQAEGFSVVSIAEECPGVSDDVVLERANNTGALLLTGDKDFGELEQFLFSHSRLFFIRAVFPRREFLCKHYRWICVSGLFLLTKRAKVATLLWQNAFR